MTLISLAIFWPRRSIASVHRNASGSREHNREKSHQDIRDLERNATEKWNQFLQLLLCSGHETEKYVLSFVFYFDTSEIIEEEAAIENTPLPLSHFELH